ncbi:hypothetical protein ASPVEDRAFT_558514 [Aspergillus versicolor CBS 583.65]|uniref:Uncharacterized protein n=1 Tax=Aspergillus versicolor CBS 583.65 TaxID=1036611 RepID=A0A1L9PFJ6_ASPVE|nr:uncharacterized protein ASPVEDRAFT_558514 [Aspergillus versicolor CBS 583.65]OJJ00280.1 hypothetical protein ASPVEDRAFT_558514 [Aspergillus versicolor CBS 583.65]
MVVDKTRSRRRHRTRGKRRSLEVKKRIDRKDQQHSVDEPKKRRARLKWECSRQSSCRKKDASVIASRCGRGVLNANPTRHRTQYLRFSCNLPLTYAFLVITYLETRINHEVALIPTSILIACKTCLLSGKLNLSTRPRPRGPSDQSICGPRGFINAQIMQYFA